MDSDCGGNGYTGLKSSYVNHATTVESAYDATAARAEFQFSDCTGRIGASVDISATVQVVPQLAGELVNTVVTGCTAYTGLRTMWLLIRPKATLSLKPGETRELGDGLMVEKTGDGKIILYETVG